jgi:murein DD-endopeptidase MepM/ murein hydrolase activator NlpD
VFHPGTAPAVQEAAFGRALRVDGLRAAATLDLVPDDTTVEANSLPVVFPGLPVAAPAPAVVKNNRAAVASYLSAVSRSKTSTAAPASTSTLAWPMRGPITGAYGERRGNGRHPGIDISGPTGTAVRAAGPGTVAAAGYVGGYEGYGIIVVINHGNGMMTIYAHLSRAGVSIGQVVDSGQFVGSSGCTGTCTGPHLHFEVRVGGSTRNPMNYLP